MPDAFSQLDCGELLYLWALATSIRLSIRCRERGKCHLTHLRVWRALQNLEQARDTFWRFVELFIE